MKRYFIMMEPKKVDTVYSLQLAFARATPLLPFVLFFFLFLVISYLSVCLFWRLNLRQESCKECSIYFLTVHNMYWKWCFLTLALHYMRSECFPEMSTHQTFHLILSSSNIKYMLLDNKFSEKNWRWQSFYSLSIELVISERYDLISN